MLRESNPFIFPSDLHLLYQLTSERIIHMDVPFVITHPQLFAVCRECEGCNLTTHIYGVDKFTDIPISYTNTFFSRVLPTATATMFPSFEVVAHTSHGTSHTSLCTSATHYLLLHVNGLFTQYSGKLWLSTPIFRRSVSSSIYIRHIWLIWRFGWVML